MTPIDALGGEDVRSVFLLVNEVRELGRSSLAWRNHAARRLRDLVGGRAVLDGETLPFVKGPAQFFECGHLGYGALERDVCLGLFSTPDPRLPDPIWFGLERYCDANYTLLRRDFIPDKLWDRAVFVNEVRRRFGLEDGLFSSRRLASFKCNHMLSFHRCSDDAPFTERERQLLSLFHDELQRLFDVAAIHPGFERLTPALEAALGAMRTDASEKQAADALGISAHTLHERNKRLYRLFGAHSRPELLRITAPYYREHRPRLEAEQRKPGEPMVYQFQ